MTYKILHGDSVEQLRTLADGSVQMVLTSCPYDDARLYSGRCEWDFQNTARELYRVLCAGGICCWNVNDMMEDGSETLTSCEQKIFFRRECGFLIHDTMIWHKPNFANPSKNRYHQMFEYVFVLSKGKPKTFNPIRDKPNKYPNGPWGKNTYRKQNGDMELRRCNPAKPFGMRGNVWKGNTVGQELAGKSLKHPAMMPKWLARDLILSFSNPGDACLDPFAGSFTTCIQAMENGRSAIGIDVSQEYVEMGRRLLPRITPPLLMA